MFYLFIAHFPVWSYPERMWGITNLNDRLCDWPYETKVIVCDSLFRKNFFIVYWL